MSKFTIDQIREIMYQPDYIRNMCVIAHVDHGKTTLTDSLIARAGIISAESAGDQCVMDKSDPEASARGITIKATGISLAYETNVLTQKDNEPYLINLIDSPGHIDFNAEVTAALRVTDGALVVVDFVDGVSCQTETVLRQALTELIKPVLFINKVDRGILELQLDGEALYQRYLRIIEDANAIISTYECQNMPESQQVYPVRGTVAFGSGYFGWAFTLTRFARIYAEKFKIDYDKLMERFWGDNYFNPVIKRFTTKGDNGKGGQLPRAFVQFIMNPIAALVRNIMDGKHEEVDKMLAQLGIVLKAEERQKVPKDLFKCVFQKWINAADALIEMIICKLPSPKKAQAYRAAALYEGPIDDACCKAIANCDKDGPTMVFISKMVPSDQSGRFYAFGRVFGGTVATGDQVQIMGPNYKPGSKTDLYMTKIGRTMVMMGKTAESVADVPCGNTVALMGIDKYLSKQGTITNDKDAHCIRAMKYTVSPVVRIAVEVLKATDLPKLTEGLRKLAKSDPMIQCYSEESGEHIVAGAGELHVQVCLKALEKDYAKCQLKMGDPVVSYRETVTEESSQICLSKSQNMKNRLYLTAEPLDDKLAKAIEDDEVTAKLDAKVLKTKLRDEFSWDPDEASKVWCFGPDATGPNLFVDMTKGAQYVNEIRDSIENGMHWATREGVLTDEQLRGVRFTMHDVQVHQDSAHRRPQQILPMTRRCCYASQLTAKPCFQEPLYLVEIKCSTDAIGSVYTCVTSRRGEVFFQEPIAGTSMTTMRAYLPVAESFGFTEKLQRATHGHAFPQMIFDHWRELSGDPNDGASRVGILVDQIRKRKGLKAGVPKLENFLDKL